MVRTDIFLVASLLVITSIYAADKPTSLERQLLGAWQGPACGGDWTYGADGTFYVQHYSPGNKKMVGTWEVRWNAIPPTLVRTCKSSDDPDLVGKTWEVKITQLDQDGLAYQYADQFPGGHTVRYTRMSTRELVEQELAEIQGTWVPLYYEAKGQSVPVNFKQIIQGDKVTFYMNGEMKAEGKVVLDATKNPRHLDFQFSSGQTDLIIYARAGDYVIYCGNRDGQTRPSEFASDTVKGGEYLQVWKIEK